MDDKKHVFVSHIFEVREVGCDQSDVFAYKIGGIRAIVFGEGLQGGFAWLLEEALDDRIHKNEQILLV